MGSAWDHPQLGRFKHDADGGSWIGTVDIPAFKAFVYDGITNPRYKGPRRQSAGKHVLAFEADDETDVPSPKAIALASKMLVNQKKLVAMVVQALWDDFNGRGPNSGMWWHGDLRQVAEAMWADLPPPKVRDDLLRLMKLMGITIRKGVYRYDKPVVELSFAAPFEDEHGIGVLTDGRSILGTGYSADVTPFEAR